MNKRKSGNLFQDWIEDWLLKSFPGCVVHNQKSVSTFLPKMGVWTSKRNDIFGCVDLVAIGTTEVCDKTLWIQATLDTGIGRKEKELLEIPWHLDHSCVEIWQKKEGGRVVIRRLQRDGTFKIWAEIRRGKFCHITKNGGC